MCLDGCIPDRTKGSVSFFLRGESANEGWMDKQAALWVLVLFGFEDGGNWPNLKDLPPVS